MSSLQFNNIKFLSNIEISKSIIRVEKKLFDLKFKKATRQSFRSHEIKHFKHKLAQLKTLLSQRLNKLGKDNGYTIVDHLIEKKDYLNKDF